MVGHPLTILPRTDQKDHPALSTQVFPSTPELACYHGSGEPGSLLASVRRGHKQEMPRAVRVL